MPSRASLSIERIDLGDLVIDFDFPVAFPKFVIKPTKLVQHFDVARLFFEQRSASANIANLRPAGRQRGFFQNQICLPIVRLFFQNFLQHFDRVFRVLFISRCAFMMAIGAVEILKKLFFADLLFVTSARRNS